MARALSRWHQDIAQPRLRCQQLLSQVHVRGAICRVLLSVLCSQSSSSVQIGACHLRLLIHQSSRPGDSAQ